MGHTLVHVYLYRHDDGRVTANFWTTEEAERRGVPHMDHRWTACPADDDEDHSDDAVAVSLGCAALGSRLLRLSSKIYAQKSLFAIRNLGGVDA